MAEAKVQAEYVQKRTRTATSSQGPDEGTPYCWMLEPSVAMVSQKVGMNSDSVGWFNERVKLPRWRMKRAVIRFVRTMNRTRSRMKMVVPIVVRPRKRWGSTDNRREMPPVDIVRVNHAQVKWCSLSCKETFEGGAGLSCSIVR